MPRWRRGAIKITRIEIKDIDPPKNLVEFDGAPDDGGAREARRASSRRRACAQSEILKAEGEKQAQILEAEGRREAAFRDAEAREREAEAEAKATEMVSRAIAEGDVQAINYFVAQKYIEALAAFATSPNQKTFLMPVEASALIGALGGIASIARDAFGDARTCSAAAPAGRVPSAGSSGTPVDRS